MLQRSAFVALLALAACADDDAPATDAAVPAPDALVPPAIGQFPANFMWGTAIAPYQVEGNLHNTDWYQWETKCGDACSGQSADDGPDFWNLYETDLDNVQSLGNNSLRLGIEWARVFPTQASWDTMTPDAEAVAHYHDILAAARSRGIEPMVTLHHFSTPTWIVDLDDLASKRGWEDDATIAKFGQFAAWAAAEYGAEVDWWVTINEPIPYIVAGWYAGAFPPGVHGDVPTAIAVAHRLIEAHVAAYDAIHLADVVDADGDSAAAMVSIATHNRVFLPKNPANAADVRAADVFRYLFNQVFTDAIVLGAYDPEIDMTVNETRPEWVGRADYIGLNYYGVSVVVNTGTEDNYPVIGIPFQNELQNQGLSNPLTDFGWSIYPEGFRTVIDEMAVYGLPIVITENGLADQNDSQRPRFLIDHLYEIGRAIDDGIPMRGYMYWSLVDNFEWAAGYCPSFGLYHFDPVTKARYKGEGADLYARIIAANTVPLELFTEYPDHPDADFFCPRQGP